MERLTSSQFQRKLDFAVEGMVEGVKKTGIAKRVTVCPHCDADLTEWGLRRDLERAFITLLMKHYEIIPD